jgi:hypothetical protein
VRRLYGEGIALIWPDGHLGYTGPAAAPRLDGYLQQIFG